MFDASWHLSAGEFVCYNISNYPSRLYNAKKNYILFCNDQNIDWSVMEGLRLMQFS